QTRDRIFGSQMWGRMCEDILTITSDQEVPDLRNLTVEHRNARREKFVLEFKDGLLVEAPRGSELEGTAETRKKRTDLTDCQAAMIQVIEGLPPGTRVTAKMFPWINNSSVSRYLAELSLPGAGWVGKDDADRWITLKGKEVCA